MGTAPWCFRAFCPRFAARMVWRDSFFHRTRRRSGEAGVRLQPPDGDADLSTRRGALGAPRGDSTFLVDFAFWEHNSNADVYAAVGRQCLEHAFTGYNSTVFAYGQTGSGKVWPRAHTHCTLAAGSWSCLFALGAGWQTHTMMGDPSSEVASMGLIPRLSMELFDEIARRGNRAQVSVSYVEIYGQQVRLLHAVASHWQ